jgi:integrase
MYKRNNSWHSDFTIQGRRYYKSWGPISKTVAIEKEQKFRTEIREGKHQQKIRKIFFENFSEKYLDHARLNKKPKSALRNETSINMLRPHFKGKLIQAINPFMIEQYKRARRDEGKAPATVNRELATLRNMLNKAVEWGYLGINPAAGVKAFKENNEQMWVVTGDEEAKLLTECEKRPQRKGGKYLKDLVQFAINTGMRQSEIFNLKKTDVKLSNNYVVATDTKNHDTRNVPLNNTTTGILERRLKGSNSEYVFHNSKGDRVPVLTNAFWYAVKEAGLIKYDGDKRIRFRFHDCRHTFGSRLGMAGTDLKTIMEIMGHKTHVMAMRYQHPAPSHKLAAVKTLDQPPTKSTTSKIELIKTA